MNGPLISCICPTYKRPACLANAVACFLAQDYPHRELIILDDAGQFEQQSGLRWKLYVSPLRYPTLPDKLNELLKLAGGRIIAVWEDDDIFLPWHLSAIAAAHVPGEATYFVPANVLSTYNEQKRGAHVEPARGRFHGSWAFTDSLCRQVRGYPATDRLGFDQQMGARLRAAAKRVVEYGDPVRPSYVYRWGNGEWHGSQRGESGFRQLWDEVGARPTPFVGELRPELDDETKRLMERFVGRPS